MKLRAGDWVEVKEPREIAETLDTEGTLDGLPFMPEMLEYCGQQFRVLRRSEKTCVEFPTTYWMREFRGNDVVLLERLRCSGGHHDGCQRACMLFWKTAWLRKADTRRPAATLDQSGHEPLRSKLKTTSVPGRYCCQSTELAKATQPLTRTRILLHCLDDIRSRSRGVFEMVWLILVPLWRKATSRIPRRRLAGDLTRTPVGDLKLQPGEWVQIKSASEILRTLDVRGRNRGLICDYGMCRFSGGKYTVRNRLDRMISEPTGEMRSVESTVILDGLTCLCWNSLGGCPREEFMYWREVWLERARAEKGA
ncbi:MAG: hypothetical protein ACREV3_13235 [Gammaproteobacteria bacterium]